MIAMNSPPQSIEVRAQSSLDRLGFDGVQVIKVADGRLKLTGQVPSLNERCIAVAIANTVAGVVTVTSDLSKAKKNDVSQAKKPEEPPFSFR